MPPTRETAPATRKRSGGAASMFGLCSSGVVIGLGVSLAIAF
jgi:hypothetical protein